VKGSKAVVGGPKVFFNSFEVAGRVAVIGGGGLTLAVWNIEVEIIHRGRDPDGGSAQPLDIRHFLLDARQITAPVKPPVGLGRIEKAGALRRIVVAGISIKEAVCNYLVDDLFLEVLRAAKRGGTQQDEESLQQT